MFAGHRKRKWWKEAGLSNDWYFICCNIKVINFADLFFILLEVKDFKQHAGRLNLGWGYKFEVREKLKEWINYLLYFNAVK